jgi:hypothetical protein
VKFSELIVSARYRLNDIYDMQGNIIATAPENGRAYSSLFLQSAAKEAISEMLRILSMMSDTRNTDLANASYKLPVKLTSAGSINFNGIKFYKLLGLNELTDTHNVYTYVEPVQFEALKREFVLAPDESPSLERYFTYSKVNETLTVEYLPKFTQERDGCAIVFYPYEDDAYDINSDKELYFSYMEDIILDFIDKVVALRDRRMEDVKLMQSIIQFKLIGRGTNE